MGCGATFVCKTHRETWYCGYGSYGRLHDRAKRAPQIEHVDCDTAIITGDATHVDDDGDLCIENQFDSEKWIIGYRGFTRHDFSDHPLPIQEEAPKPTE